jgi:hypothetical protein
MGDFLRFETMITPGLIQVLFWLAAIFCIVAGIITMIGADDVGARVGGAALLIFGPLGARIYAEILIVVFRINDHLRHIDHNTQRV